MESKPSKKEILDFKNRKKALNLHNQTYPVIGQLRLE